MANLYEMIKRGVKSSTVKILQTQLNKFGYKLDVDGEFGPLTQQAVIDFQTKYGLEVDGIVGNETWGALFTKSPTEEKEEVIPTVEEEKEEKQSIAPKTVYADVMVAAASKDENGCYSGGIAGDQSGYEVKIQNWFSYSWNVILRPLNAQDAEKMATMMEDAANNPNIGYDQSERNSLYPYAKAVNFEMSKINTPCECDCSSLVSICCIGIGCSESAFYGGGNMRCTSNLRQPCLASGKFCELTDSKYTQSKDYLKRGDIILYEAGHVVVCLQNGIFAEAGSKTVISSSDAASIRVTANVLNVRSGPSTSYPVCSTVGYGQTYTIDKMQDGWGHLSNGAGWISLAYTEAI